MKIKTTYTVGFLFNEALTQVLLQRKTHPEWQKGRLNGVGGHINIGEDAKAAHVREFGEECACPFEVTWRQFGELDGMDFNVALFYARASGDLISITPKTDELLEVVDVHNIQPNRTTDLIENLPWIISAAIDSINDLRPSYIIAHYCQGDLTGE